VEIRATNKDIKLFFNYPYIVYKNRLIRIDSAPFVSNSDVFITDYAYTMISNLMEEPEENPAVETVKEKPVVKIKKKKPVPETEEPTEVQAKEVQQAAPVPVPAKKELIIVSREKPAKALHRKIIVIDPGHGGKDPGAQANGIDEKDITLDVASRVVGYLRQYPVGVLITRDTDDFISLKDRAGFANIKKADLFLSIHCNSSYNREVQGVRTYIYSRTASSKEAAEAAKAENKNVSFFEFLLNDLRKSAYEYLSIEAAGYIQRNMVRQFKQRWTPTERAPFYVLANTNMPSVLVEIGFISNYREAEQMQSSLYRDRVAHTIADGIMEYIGKTAEMQSKE
jgi:N-acetylmuramoyl-L-alanine amidase